MSDLSPNKGRRFLGPARLGLALILGMGLPLPVWAQSQLPAPDPLSPPNPPAQGQPAIPGAPLQLLPPETAPETAPAAPVPDGSTTDGSATDGSAVGNGGLTASPLSPVGTEAVGLIDEQLGGFPPTLWQGSSLPWLSSLLPRLPAPILSPTLRDLQRQLLLSSAAAPEADAAIGGADPLLPLRAERLRAMGFAEDADRLEELGAAGILAPGDPHGAIEARFGAGDMKGACLEVDRQMQRSTVPDLYLSRAILFCALIRGDKEGAALGRDLLREREDLDPVAQDFVALISAMLGDAHPDKIALAAEPDALNMAVLRAAGLDASLPGEGREPIDDPHEDARKARDGTLPLADRIAAGRRALAYGLIAAEEMAVLYRAYPQGDADPFLLAGAKSTPENDALLYRAIAAGQLPERRAHLIALVMARATGEADLFAIAALYAPIAAEIAPNENLAWFAPVALRLAILTGDIERARSWLSLADRMSVSADATKAAAIEPYLPAMRLIADLAGMENLPAFDFDLAQSWQLSARAPAELGDFYRVALAILIADPAGAKNPPGLEPAENSPAALIAPALAEKKLGEGIALILIALDDERVIASDRGAVLAAIRGLVAAGLVREARALLAEIAIRDGL